MSQVGLIYRARLVNKDCLSTSIYKTRQRLGPEPISEAMVPAVYMMPQQKALKCKKQTSSHLSPAFAALFYLSLCSSMVGIT